MARAVFLLALVVLLIASARSFLPEETSLVGSGAALAFGFVLLAAMQMGTIVSAVRLPKLTGYLVLGFLAGPSVFNFVSERMVSDLKLVNNVAIGLIALSAGTELNLKRLRPRLRAVLAVGGVSVPAAIVIVAAVIFALPHVAVMRPYIGFLLGLTSAERAAVSLVMAVVVACLSPMVVIALINETASAGPFSETALGVVVLADLAILFIFSGANALASSVFGMGQGSANITDLLIHIFGSVAVGAVVGVIFVVYMKRINRRVALFAFAVCFVAAEAATRLHLSPLLMCLTTGLLIENLSDVEGDKLIRDMEPARVPVFAVFFAVAGAGLHWKEFRDLIPLVALLAVVRAVALYLGCRLGMIVGNIEKEQRPFLPSILVSQSGVAIGLAILVKKQFPTWGDPVSTCLLGVVMINEMVGPILLRNALVRSGEAGQRAVVPPSSGH